LHLSQIFFTLGFTFTIPSPSDNVLALPDRTITCSGR
jgi:hypothetical protein